MDMVKTSKMDVKKLVLMGVFIALSYVGALLKIRGTIAFDAMPAFFASIVLGPIYGGAIGFLGHMLTAITSGFPHTIPVHIATAVMMFVSCYMFGMVHKKMSFYIADVIGIVMNGLVSLAVACLVFEVTIGGGVALFGMLIGWLMVGATLNIIIAEVLYQSYFKKYPTLWR